jgi:hypothetical protein
VAVSSSSFLIISFSCSGYCWDLVKDGLEKKRATSGRCNRLIINPLYSKTSYTY